MTAFLDEIQGVTKRCNLPSGPPSYLPNILLTYLPTFSQTYWPTYLSFSTNASGLFSCLHIQLVSESSELWTVNGKNIAKYVNRSCAFPGAVSAGVVFGAVAQEGNGREAPWGQLDTSAQLDHLLILRLIIFPHQFDWGAVQWSCLAKVSGVRWRRRCWKMSTKKGYFQKVEKMCQYILYFLL